MQIYYDRLATYTIAINAVFTAVAGPTSPPAPSAIYRLQMSSTAAWAISSDGGTTEFDVPANVVVSIDLKDPFGKLTFKNSAAISCACLGMNAG
jgi:hypothetical protein